MSASVLAARCQKKLEILPSAGHSGRSEKLHIADGVDCPWCEIELLRQNLKAVNDFLEIQGQQIRLKDEKIARMQRELMKKKR